MNPLLRLASTHRRTACLAALALALTAAPATRASSLEPRTTEQQLAAADAALRATVLATRSFRDPETGRIWTDVWLRTEETFKGALPAVIRLRQRGGTVSDGGEADSLSPQFVVGEERLVFLGRHADGTVFARRGEAGAEHLHPTRARAAASADEPLAKLRRARGAKALTGAELRGTSADGTATLPATTAGAAAAASVTATGLLTDANGIPSRNPEPDRGAPIPYLVDVDKLPAGITRAQALEAVQSALAAWSAVSSLQFTFEGVVSFGRGADAVATDDGRLRIQLHDTYGRITGGDGVLGIGGIAWTTVAPFATVGGEGGRVGAQEFHRVVRSYVVISDTEAALQNLATLKEVLCHEIGHSLGLAHSSDNQNETDAVKRDAAMFAYIHADGRGARLGTYDPPAIRLVHPADNTPPWTCNRVLRILTGPTTPSFAGANELSLFAFDRTAATFTWSSANADTATPGTFTLTGATLRFTPAAYYGAGEVDPAGNQYYDLIYVRATDSVNASPWATVRVVAFAPDTYPAGGDGLPDAWMSTNFGSPDPAAGAGRGPADDPDGDGFTNLQEYRQGTDPRVASSHLAITGFSLTELKWTARPYELYAVERSDDLLTWSTAGATLTLPTTTTATATNFPTAGKARQFFRVRLLP